MRKHLIVFLLLYTLLWPAVALPQQAATPARPVSTEAPAGGGTSGGSLFLGLRGLDNSDWMGRVNEFEANKDGARPSIGFNYWYGRGSWFFDFFGENRGDSRAQSYSLKTDLNRWVRVSSSMERFLHRLDHDPLTNLDAAKGTVVVRHDNLAPNRALAPGRNEIDTKISGYLTSWLTWRASHRFQQMHGDVQTRAISKCSSCHVTATATSIDQKANDLSGGFTARLGRRVAVHYDYTNRQFKEHGQTPTLRYDVAQHPGTLSRMFLNRVSFDGTTNGKLPYALVPGFRKDSHDVKVNVDLPKDSRLSAQLLKARARNTHTNLDLDVLAWGGRYTIPIGPRASFKAQFRKTDMSSDDVSIELNEPAAPEGPQAGKTFTQAYPTFGTVNWTRGSVINRRDIVASGELNYRLARLTTVRGGYQFRSIRRDNFDVERTDRNRAYFMFHSRKAKSWNARLRYTFDDIDEPFLHKKAALSPVIQPYPSPGTPPSPLTGLQYFTLYAARQANLTNQPARSQFMEPSFTWTPSPRAALTLHYRMRLENNDHLNFGKWSHDMHMPGAELWVSPIDKLNFTLAYSFQKDVSNTMFVLPAFDG